MERKKLIELIVSIAIAIMFLTSYVSLTSFNNNTKPSTTTIPTQLVYATGIASAPIVDYNNILNINLICKNSELNSTAIHLGKILSSLEGNNSILNFYSLNTRFVIQTGNSNASGIYGYIKTKFNQTEFSCSNFTSTAVVQLPTTMSMNVQGQSLTIDIPQNLRKYPLPITLSSNTNGSIKLKVAVLLNTNGSVYGNLSIIKI